MFGGGLPDGTHVHGIVTAEYGSSVLVSGTQLAVVVVFPFGPFSLKRRERKQIRVLKMIGYL